MSWTQALTAELGDPTAVSATTTTGPASSPSLASPRARALLHGLAHTRRELDALRREAAPDTARHRAVCEALEDLATVDARLPQGFCDQENARVKASDSGPPRGSDSTRQSLESTSNSKSEFESTSKSKSKSEYDALLGRFQPFGDET